MKKENSVKKLKSLLEHADGKSFTLKNCINEDTTFVGSEEFEDEESPVDTYSDETEETFVEPEKESEGLNPKVEQLLSKIRTMVLQGLAELADNPAGIEYESLKKLLAFIDKPMESSKNNKNA